MVSSFAQNYAQKRLQLTVSYSTWIVKRQLFSIVIIDWPKNLSMSIYAQKSFSNS